MLSRAINRLFLNFVLGLLFSINLVEAQTRTAAGTVTSYSLKFDTISGFHSDGYAFEMYTSTPDAIQNNWPQGFSLNISYEFRPDSAGSSTYRTDFALYNLSYGRYYGRGTLSSSMPLTDSDGNGFPDALQLNRAFSYSISANTSEYVSQDGGYSWSFYGNKSYSVTFSRSAGSYSGTFSGSGNGATFSGGFELKGGTGNAVYDLSTKSIRFEGTSFGFDTTGTGTSTFTRINNNQVAVAGFSFYTSDGDVRSMASLLIDREIITAEMWC